MSAIFLLTGRLTCWSRKYSTRIDPTSIIPARFEVDIHSWVIAFLSTDTFRYLVTLTFDLLTLNICHAWRVTWPTLPPSVKTPLPSVLELWVITFAVSYHWKCVRGYCACTESHDPSKTITYLESPTPTPICLFTIQLLIGLRRRLTVVYSWASPGGQKQLHFLYARPRFAYSLCNFSDSTMNKTKVICEKNARPVLKNVCDSAHARNHVIC